MSNTSALQRPLPRTSITSEFFWNAAKQGKLALQYDPAAGRYQFWPRSTSTMTGEQNLEWRTVSGLGRVYSFTETHIPTPGFALPYILGLIELDEKVRIVAKLVNVTAERVRIGMRVRVTFEKLANDVNYFAFEPAEQLP